MSKVNNPPLHAVIWDDAHGDPSMFDNIDVDHKPYRFTSVGFLVRSDEVGVSLASEVGEDGKFRGHTFVPRVMVVEEFALPAVKRPRKKRVPSGTTP